MEVIKVQSKKQYQIDTIIFDEATKEVFKVLACDRIGVVDEVNWGLTLEKVEKES